jgi:FHS family glucose/mannose:H+ symporter-like MFS transporter
MFNKKIIFGAACLAMLVLGIVMTILGSALPSIIEKFGIDKQKASSLFLMLSFGLLLASMVFGPIVDRYGYKILLTQAVGAIFIGIILVATANSFSFLRFIIFVLGFEAGIINGGASALVADISEGERGAKLSLLGAFFCLGGFGVPFISGLLLNYFSYENILIGVGIFVFFPFLFFIFPKFPKPKHAQGFPLKQGVKLLKEKLILLIGFIAFFESGLEISVPGWSSTFILEELGAKSDKAVFYLSFYWLGMLVSRLVFAKLMKRISSVRIFKICIIFAILGSVLMIFSNGIVVAAIGLTLIGIGMAMVFPIILAYISDKYPEFSGTAFSIVLTIALIGGMILPYLIGSMGNWFGLRYSFSIITFSLACMFIIFGFARLVMKKNR